MDPLTAMGIACNVMQIISFGHEVFDLARRVGKDGSPDASLTDKLVRLSTLSEELQSSLNKQQQKAPLNQTQLRLQKVAAKCLRASNALSKELDQIKWKDESKGGNSKTERRLLSQTWKLLWRKSKIDKLQEEMTVIEQTMQTTILTDIWMSKEAANLPNEASFQILDFRLQHFISKYAQGHRHLSDLVVTETSAIKEEIQLESAKTRIHVSEQLKEQETARANSEQCEKLLKSLEYDTMNARRNRVTESHEKTLNWVFDRTITDPWDSFLQWLESDQRVYWINRKPGSGKSTLMKFLIDDQRTKDALGKWATNCSVISFFLWNSGTLMQRSVQGLLCSLLHQLLTKYSSICNHLIAIQPDLLSKTNYNDWSDTELERALIQSISISKQPLCIFLDGLDEIDREEGPIYLTDLVERLQRKSTAKICISSRPEIPLQEAFSRYPKLRVQDLTRADISSFVADSLQNDLHFWDEALSGKQNRELILDTVINTADGVFLWVHLVLKSLRRGSMHIDSYDQILSRIRELPKTLEELYKSTWERLGEDESRYRTEAARYFKIVQDSQGDHDYRFHTPFSLFDLSIACDDKIQSMILESNKIPPVAILLRNAENCRRRVEGCSGGLLEFRSNKPIR